MASKAHVIVIGAGLFGSIAATLARRRGYEVTVVDNGAAWAASKASGCVLAPSWLSSLSGEQIASAMGVLNDLYTVHDVTFKTNLLKSFKAKRVDRSEVLVAPDVTDEVEAVGAGGFVKLSSGRSLQGKVLVAAGVASPTLVRMPAIRALWGASAVFSGEQLAEPRIHVYAPYRQAVAFNMDRRRVWMGDGTALVTKTWEKESEQRMQATADRGRSLFKLKGKANVTVGARPYVEGHKAGFFAKVAPNVWVSTGGAKNGTVLAAYQAWQFIKELG